MTTIWIYGLLLIGGIAALIFIAYFTTEILRHREKMASKESASLTAKSKTAGMFDMVDMVMAELNKIGEEQAAIGKKFNLTDAQIQEITNPIRDRYNKVKWAKDNKGWVMPLAEWAGPTIQKFIKGLIP